LVAVAKEDEHMSAQDVAELKETLGQWMQEQSKIVVEAVKDGEQEAEWRTSREVVGLAVGLIKAGRIVKEDLPKEMREKAMALDRKYPGQGYDVAYGVGG
jgi:hypothetical protein